MNYETQEIAERLQKARTAKGLSQRDLSALAGIPQAQISRIEAGAVDMRLSSLVALAHALDLELSQQILLLHTHALSLLLDLCSDNVSVSERLLSDSHNSYLLYSSAYNLGGQ